MTAAKPAVWPRACPSWCGEAAVPEHQWVDQDDYDPVRFHYGHEQQVSCDESGNPVQVAIEMQEKLDGTLFGPSIVMRGNYVADAHTGAETRQLAAALLNAADELDRITG